MFKLNIYAVRLTDKKVDFQLFFKGKAIVDDTIDIDEFREFYIDFTKSVDGQKVYIDQQDADRLMQYFGEDII